MTAFRAKGRKFYDTQVPTESGKWFKHACGTRDPVIAGKIDKMIEALGAQGAQAWDVLRTVTDKPQRWSLSELYRRWAAVPSTKFDTNHKPIPPSTHERLVVLRADLAAVNLIPLVDAWHAVLVGPSRAISADSANHYRSAVRDYICDALGVERWKDVGPSAIVAPSQFTEPLLRVHIEEMDDVEPGTVRKRGIGIRDFGRWLVGRHIIGVNPMAGIVLPAAGDPLCHHVDTHEAQLLADAQPGQYRLYSATLAGTGIEVSTGLALRVRHVETRTKEIRAAGTKTYNRDRIVRVAEWAWPYVLEAIEGKHPDALVFDAIADRWDAQAQHNAAIDALVARGHAVFLRDDTGAEHRYTMRDQRHTWAVRATRSGWPIEGVSRQLGHKNGILALKVYGRFSPTQQERDRWEGLSAARDQAASDERQQRAEEGK